MSRVKFTGSKDVDRKILEYVPDENLYDICNANKYLQSVCNDDSVWINKIIQKHGRDKLDQKPDDTTWRSYYIGLTLRSPPMGFKSFLFITDKAKQFFTEAELGMYQDKPLQAYMTELFNLSSLANMYILLQYYLKLNGLKYREDNRTYYRTSPLMDKYFSEEYDKIPNFDKYKFGHARIAGLAQIMISKAAVDDLYLFKIPHKLQEAVNKENFRLLDV